MMQLSCFSVKEGVKIDSRRSLSFFELQVFREASVTATIGSDAFSCRNVVPKAESSLLLDVALSSKSCTIRS